MLKGLTRRMFAEKMEVRESDGKVTIGGLAVPFGRPSVDMGGWTEEFQGATLDSRMAVLWAHSSDIPLGTMASGVRAEITSRGVEFELENPNISDRQLAAIRRGDLPHASFGFRDATDRKTMREGKPHRIVENALIKELSVGVLYPAYDSTEIQAAKRSMEEWAAHEQGLDLEHYQLLQAQYEAEGAL